MTDVNVKTAELLGTLKKNRETHRTIFLEAQAGYRAQVILELDAMAAEARGNKRIRRAVTLVEPVDQTREYDRAIRMLEMAVDDTLRISAEDFQCYVMDEWRWKSNFTASNSHYSKTLQEMG